MLIAHNSHIPHPVGSPSPTRHNKLRARSVLSASASTGGGSSRESPHLHRRRSPVLPPLHQNRFPGNPAHISRRFRTFLATYLPGNNAGHRGTNCSCRGRAECEFAPHKSKDFCPSQAVFQLSGHRTISPYPPSPVAKVINDLQLIILNGP